MQRDKSWVHLSTPPLAHQTLSFAVIFRLLLSWFFLVPPSILIYNMNWAKKVFSTAPLRRPSPSPSNCRLQDSSARTPRAAHTAARQDRNSCSSLFSASIWLMLKLLVYLSQGSFRGSCPTLRQWIRCNFHGGWMRGAAIGKTCKTQVLFIFYRRESKHKGSQTHRLRFILLFHCMHFCPFRSVP